MRFPTTLCLRGPYALNMLSSPVPPCTPESQIGLCHTVVGLSMSEIGVDQKEVLNLVREESKIVVRRF